MNEDKNSSRGDNKPESPVPPQLMKIKTESLANETYNADLGNMSTRDHKDLLKS